MVTKYFRIKKFPSKWTSIIEANRTKSTFLPMRGFHVHLIQEYYILPRFLQIVLPYSFAALVNLEWRCFEKDPYCIDLT